MSNRMHDRNVMTNRIHREQGFTLIEAMLSSAILAVGLLGLAGMTTLSFTRNSDSNEVMVATNLATELVERMQFNRRNLVNGYNGINLTSANPALCTQAALTQPVARGDCLQWQTRLFASGLAGVQAQVAVAAVGPVGLNQNNIGVTVTWIGSSQNTIAGGSAAWVPGTKRVTVNTMIAPE
ncbi:MAG: prepilin-type N-terminal cleavage/methylation domain-containing protein [Nitrospirae bacterium]|nr:prepilin-type N-terminal cleavage/methylation domain-containing protein [Nitrospirota bacterium]